MQVYIDCGNTNTVFSVYIEDICVKSWRIRTDSDRTADEYASFIEPVMRIFGVAIAEIKSVMISSVVPGCNDNLTNFCNIYAKTAPVFVNYSLCKQAGLEVNIKNPETVGSDRLVNAFAVKSENKYPAIVIDFGTATTFDVIDSGGAYIGGAISPGINLSMQALRQAAALLPKIDLVKPERVIGDNTVDAMRSGVFWGYAGLIEGMVSKIIAELKSSDADDATSITVLATGGLAQIYSQNIDCISYVDKELTIRGMHLLYQFSFKE